jgi:hypothetical protein
VARAQGAPSLLAAIERLAKRARDESWSHEEFLAACLEREGAARQTHGGEAHQGGSLCLPQDARGFRLLLSPFDSQGRRRPSRHGSLAEAATLFFQLVSSRYERASVIVTSNKPFGRWGEVSATPPWPPR